MSDKTIIKYTTPEQQISSLKGKGLIFQDEATAIRSLSEHGYFNIINSYKSPYIEFTDHKKIYKPGTTFEQIFSLFTLDGSLRNSIMAAMLDFEEHLRAAVADVIAKAFGTNQEDYLKWENFRDRHVTKERFGLRGILGTLRQNITSGKDPIKYYRENYGIVPPWILFRGTYFSTLVNFVHLFKSSQKEELIQKLYPIGAEESALTDIKRLFSDTLSICLEYRNLAAHGGRIYNYAPNTTFLLTDEVFKTFPDALPAHTNNDLSCGIAQLLFALNILNYDNPYNIINDTFSEEINRHCNMYPNDAPYLQEICGIKITKKHVVYVSPNTKKYHLNPNCSGIRNAHLVPYEIALQDGYLPCKRCIKQ